ncbi:hypothetical protein H0H93_008849 [Arthromyces matolae]|nr:hypothetical protein H0H93_008849 [Arthromyces matolae]
MNVNFRKPAKQMDTDTYDANFCFPLRDLQNQRVKLTPFIVSKYSFAPKSDIDKHCQPSKHLLPFFTIPSPSYEYFPWGPFNTPEEFNATLIRGRIQPSQACVLFAIYDKTKAESPGNETGTSSDVDEQIAGCIGLIDASAAHLRAEVAFVMVSPKFQRTHVASNAIGLLLHYTLDLPSEGGLGLRRMVWNANPLNTASVRIAERMGFTKEGVFRWHWVLPEGKEKGGNGTALRPEDPRPDGMGRDTVTLSLCWDDWENFARDKVDKQMQRIA